MCLCSGVPGRSTNEDDLPDEAYVHPTAEVADSASLATGVRIWNWTKIREGAVIGQQTQLGQCCFVDTDVRIGEGCKVQNGVSIYRGVTLGSRVFVGPNATFTNDRVPRADSAEFEVVPTVVEDGASIGANATIVCGVTLGARSLVAAGSVVTRDVPPYTLVRGVPARVVCRIDDDGHRIDDQESRDEH